jgi:hypothetical protein
MGQDKAGEARSDGEEELEDGEGRLKRITSLTLEQQLVLLCAS